MADFAATPPTIVEAVDPNILLNMSIETPMGGAAYNDQPGTLPNGAVCGGRETVASHSNTGICYFATEEYIGYFDPNKCYDYNTTDGYFEPNGATNATHECSNQFSGNMLNWASLTAIDEFRWAMTGGNRIVDTASTTVIKRARKHNNNSWFPIKVLEAVENIDPSTVTPWSNNRIYIYNTDFGIIFSTSYINTNNTSSALGTGEYNVRVKVCDSSAGLESNCTLYGTNYKPEGLIQKNAEKMRFALMSYSADSSENRHGGVLRSNMKYVGPTRPASSGGIETNPNAEFSSVDGTFIANPDGVSLTAGVTNSGVINYVNQFAESQGYKGHDPVGELFYECIRYYKNLGPTPENSAGLTDAEKDGFPVITNWDDPIQHYCQNNFIVGINDANPWDDKRLPGTAVTSSTTFYSWRSGAEDWGEPSNPDTDIDVTSLTNTVGTLQGITGTSQPVGCVSGNCSPSGWSYPSNRTISELGKAFGTAPGPEKQNSYYIAGLAYYAKSQDIRSDFTGQQSITTFMIDTQEYNSNPLTGQMNMLWLAGKYGGFEEINNNDTNSDSNQNEPDLAAEWDKDGDGEPDNYVLATNPLRLVNGLARAFANVQKRINAGSAAAVIANNTYGDGALYQALYEPKSVVADKQVTWSGTLHSLFIDSKGLLREDSDGDAALDGYATDKVVQIRYDSASKTTKVYRYDTTDGDISGVTPTEHTISEMDKIWDARDQLAAIASGSITSQRAYISPAGGGRHVLTWIDNDNDGSVDNGETLDFVSGNFPATDNRFRYLDVPQPTAADLVDFIRGKEGIAGFRSRTIDYDNDGTDEVWRLGDIVHSSPLVVAKPNAGYDTRYGDSSYAAFRNHYADRRQVVYAGANDGMLHAFNGGFWQNTSKRFITDNGTDTVHPLGSELWAYIPMNLLPHLQWLKATDYPHVYYVDGPPQAFDVNIFSEDADHPGGWGTILVVTMRFGGGAIDIDTDGDNVDDKTLRSAVVVLDVTNPETAPKLLAEISHANLGFTTSTPTLVKKRIPGPGINWDTPTANVWYLVFGSGPTTLSTATSTQNAKLYAYDLTNKSFVTNFGPYDISADATSFTGNMGSVDWDRDYIDDAVYFGTVGGTVSSPTGNLKRLKLSSNTVANLLAAGQPFVSAPATAVDGNGNRWVFAGTGRLFVSADNQNTTQHTFYGVKEPAADLSTAVTASDIQDVTNIEVFDDGSLTPTNLQIPTGTDIDTYSQLQAALAQKAGWKLNFSYNGTSPSTRNLTSAALIRSVLLYTDYTPATNACQPEGTSNLYAVNFKTGTAFPHGVFGFTTVSGGDASSSGNTSRSNKTFNLGDGLASNPVVHQGDSYESNTAKVVIQQSTGAIETPTVALPPSVGGRQSWRQILLNP